MNLFKPVFTKRFLYMCLGLVVLGLGIAMLRMARLGNDPYTGMCYAIADRLGMPLGNLELITNFLLFLLMPVFNKKLVGWGTLMNAFFVGYIVQFFVWVFSHWGQPQGMAVRLVLCLAALVVTSLGCSFYLGAGMGAAPYDALSLILTERLPLPFQVCRIATDGLCVVVCWVLGGILGVGIVLAVFCIGPCMEFFNRTITDPIYAGCEPPK